MYIEDSELRSLYKDSSAEHIQHIEAALMHLEQNPQDLDKLAQLLRDAHTLKGDSRMLGVTDVETIVHQIEECLMPIKQGQESLTGELCDRLYLAIDAIRQLAHTAITGEANQVDMFRLLANLMGAGDAPVVPPKAEPQAVEPPRSRNLRAIWIGWRSYSLAMMPSPQQISPRSSAAISGHWNRRDGMPHRPSLFQHRSRMYPPCSRANACSMTGMICSLPILVCRTLRVKRYSKILSC